MSKPGYERTAADGSATIAQQETPGGRRKPLEPLLLERLAETGFLGAEFGMDEHAGRIFQCLVSLKPGKPSPHIALAMVQARHGAMQEAIASMRQLLETHPDSQLVQAILGTMLLHVGEPGARQLLEAVIADGTDEGAVGVATACIEQARAQEQQPGGSEETCEFFRHYNVRA